MTTFLVATNRFVILSSTRKRVRFAQLLISEIRYQRELRKAFALEAEQFYRVDSALMHHPYAR